jgi:hypothetical protein
VAGPETPRETPPYLVDEASLDAFVAAWRAGTLPKPAWTHAAHVAVCAYHAWGDVRLDDVFAAMKAGIRAYNDAVGTANTTTSGYHETLTRFWATVVVSHLAAAQPASRADAVRSAVEVFGEARGLHAAYYRTDVVRDPVARATWVPPDLVTKQDK